MGFGPDSADVVDPATRRLVGAVDQLVSVDRMVRDEGPGRGAPVLLVRNPSGISFEVMLDRALDLGRADAPGLPLAWRSARGPVESSRYEPDGSGWARTFGGGLLTTCGLESTGMPSTVHGVHHGLHGRVGHLPAENVRWELVADVGFAGEPDAQERTAGSSRRRREEVGRGPGGELSVVVTGDVVEAALGSPTLHLRRRIVASTVRPTLRVEDVVSNRGYAEAGHMFRHHLNLGYPLVRPGTVVAATADIVEERDHRAGALQELPWKLDVAGSVAPETVVYCRPHPGPTATITVTAPDGAYVEVEQGTDTWPLLVLWRDGSAGVNVLGVEPSTSRDGGRARAELDGEVVWLEPGESRRYVTEVRAGMGHPVPAALGVRASS